MLRAEALHGHLRSLQAAGSVSYTRGNAPIWSPIIFVGFLTVDPITRTGLWHYALTVTVELIIHTMRSRLIKAWWI